MNEQVSLELKLASRKCRRCNGGGTAYIGSDYGGRISSLDTCPGCKGSGYWLQGVREDCDGGTTWSCHGGKKHWTGAWLADKLHRSDCALQNAPAYVVGVCDCGDWEPCSTCSGTGYTASTDLTVWLEAARISGYTEVVFCGYPKTAAYRVGCRISGNGPEYFAQSYLAALQAALWEVRPR